MFAFFLLAAATSAPNGQTRMFSDWIVGCDNGLACQASAMMPPALTGATLTVRRGAEGLARPEISLGPSDSAPADITADGRRLGLRFKGDPREGLTVHPRDAMRFLDAVRSARTLELIDRAGKVIDSLSPNGATAALLYIDEKQRRAGSQGALVQRGNRPDAALPKPPPLPVRYAVKGSLKPPARLSAAFIAKVRMDNDCVDETDPDLVSHDRLDARHTLAAITLVCQSGAYNMHSEVFVIRDGEAPRRAHFDDEPATGTEVLANLTWDPRARRAQTGMLGRGVGDCGDRQEYVWDGTRFRLSQVEVMAECRGVTDFIPIWRARVIER